MLTGIDYFSSLNHLIANHNQIDDLTPLADMRLLITIDLSFNRIADLTPLSDFPYLEDLDISSNLIRVISDANSVVHRRLNLTKYP